MQRVLQSSSPVVTLVTRDRPAHFHLFALSMPAPVCACACRACVPEAPLEALVGASKEEVLASCVKVEKSISDVAGNARLPESVSGKPGRRRM